MSDVDIIVPDGRFVGLLGPNGSGKSTILKAIYRVHRPVAGQVLLDGVDLLSMRPKDAARRIAVVAQESTVEFDFTVFEMVMIGRTPHKRAFDRDDDTDRAIVAEAIERVGCEDLSHRSFNTLSGGEKQRVLIARAIAQGADHLILDEPTNHLDIRYQLEVLELVAGFDMTVLAALHDLSLAALFCDSVCLLADGRDRHERPAEGGDHRRDGAPRLWRRRPGDRASRGPGRRTSSRGDPPESLSTTSDPP